MERNTFYSDIPPFQKFDRIVEDQHFQKVPPDWCLFVTDIVNSTEAIRNGRYRDVNVVGAAGISLVQNVLGSLEFPFSFGGDGGKMLVPPFAEEEVEEQLSGLKKLSKKQFDLSLRAGKVPVQKLYEEGAELTIGRYKIGPGNTVGIFRGGGSDRAENMVREQPGTYEIESSQPPNVELNGLSCRWNPIPNERGTVLSMVITSRVGESFYRRILTKLEEICGNNLEENNPVNRKLMSYKSIASCFKGEKRYSNHSFSFSFLLRVLEIIVAVAVFKWHVPPLFFDPSRYRSSLPSHSDFRKFDDMLKLTVDCSTEQAESIETFLRDLFRNDKIFYGTHRSDRSLMTCFVESVDEGNHIHFIDGGEGGYAMAAVQYKNQIASSKNSQDEAEPTEDN